MHTHIWKIKNDPERIDRASWLAQFVCACGSKMEVWQVVERLNNLEKQIAREHDHTLHGCVRCQIHAEGGLSGLESL